MPSEEIETSDKASTRTTYNIIFVTAEAAPYSKTGGLGDVCGSLPIALAARGFRLMVVSPRYVNGGSDKCTNAVELEQRAKINCFGGIHEVGFFHEYRAGVDWVCSLSYLLLVHFIEARGLSFIIHNTSHCAFFRFL